MNVHLFGNTSSPALPTFCLRKTAQEAEAQFGSDAREFIENDFYVYDGLKSLPPEDWRYVPSQLNTADCATRLVKATNLAKSLWLTSPDFFTRPRKVSSS